jgi:hypothetical protein
VDSVNQTERELVRILAYAHRLLDTRGVPRVHHPITLKDNK